MAHRGQEKSAVWSLFKVNENDQSKVTCDLCQKVLSRGGKTANSFTTTNMIKHLKSAHKEQYEQEQMAVKERSKADRTKRMSEYVQFSSRKKNKIDDQDPTASASTCGSQSQLTLKETFQLKKLWDINSSQAESIHLAIAEMIAVDSQPFSIVEDPGFQRLMKLVKPCYELPSRKYFTTKIIPAIHTKVSTKIDGILSEACNMSFTTDIWTNNADTSFIR